MWTRKELKTKGKETFKRNYWKCVLVALILTFIVGGTSGGGSAGGSGFSTRNFVNESSTDASSTDDEEEVGTPVEGTGDLIFEVNEDGGDVQVTTPDGVIESTDDIPAGAFVAFAVVIGVIILFAIAIGILFDAFLLNPLQMGCRRFFYKNLDEPAKLSNVVYAFDHNYKNIVKGMFMKDLYVVLWTLLFIIPGIIKSYEYRMVPYLLSDNSEMTYQEVLAESSKMMKGQKWRTFVLDLSFIGWSLLSILTCGILSIFYVDPYKNATDAALYEKLRYGQEA